MKKANGRVVVAVMAVAFWASAHGDALTLTWNGGATGNLSDESWSGGAEGHTSPQNGDTLIFASGGTFANDIAGLSVAKLDFRSADAVTLTGSQIAVANGGSITNTGAGPVTFNVPLSLGTAATPAVRIDVVEGSTNTFNACISGAADIYYNNNSYGTVNLMVDNDYTGKTIIYKGDVHVYANNAFGTTDGITEFRYPARDPAIKSHVYFHGITTSEDIYSYTLTQSQGVVYPAGTTNIFNGVFREENADLFSYGANARVVYNGWARFPNPSATMGSNALVEFNGEGSYFGYDFFGGGSISYGAKCYVGDSSHYVKVYAGQKRYFNCENAMYYDPAKPAFLLANGNGGVADLCGYDQTFWYINCSSDRSAMVITSAAPSTVHLTLGTNWSDAVGSCYAKFKGPISLSCEGPKPMTFGSVSPLATGTLSLTNGANVTLLNNFEWTCPSVTVSDGSTLTCGAVVVPRNVCFTINDRPASEGVEVKASRIDLGATVMCAGLTINGTVMQLGKSYGSSASAADIKDDEHFSGTGMLAVLATEPLTLTWNGGATGNFSDGSWTGGQGSHITPTIGDTLVFPSGGTFNNDLADVEFNAISVTSPDPVTFTGERIAIANSGTLNVTGAGPVTFNTPLRLGAQPLPAITINVAHGSTNTFNSCISGAADIIYSNNGTVYLMVDNDYTGKTTINKGNIHVYADKSFGTTNGITEIKYPSQTPDILNHVYFHGITTDETFNNNTHTQTDAVQFPAGTTNIFNGAYSDNVSELYSFGENAKIVFNGKVYLDNPSSRFIPYSTTIEFNGEGSSFGWEYHSGGVFWYNAQCTMLNSKGGFVGVGRGHQRRTFHFNCENALLYDATQPAYLDVVGSGGEVDLCGYDQTFRCIRCAPGYANYVSITSATPSTVHLTLQPIAGKLLAVTNYAKCYGAISLSCEGPMPMTLGTASPATGAISLSNESDVTLANGFGWNCTALNVADGSTLRVGGTVSLPNALPMAISDRVADGETEAKNSVVRLDANLTVDTLTVNGVVMPGGRTYGSSSSAAAVKDDAHFAGSGVLRVRNPCGLRIVFR